MEEDATSPIYAVPGRAPDPPDFVEETQHSSLRQGIREHRVNEGGLFSGLFPAAGPMHKLQKKEPSWSFYTFLRVLNELST